MWDRRRAVKVLSTIEDKISEHDIHHRGGELLGVVHEWIKFNFHNGSDVTWGSNDYLKGKTLTVREVERLAGIVATAAINEDRDRC
jgi:hypothetical protein